MASEVIGNTVDSSLIAFGSSDNGCFNEIRLTKPLYLSSFRIYYTGGGPEDVAQVLNSNFVPIVQSTYVNKFGYSDYSYFAFDPILLQPGTYYIGLVPQPGYSISYLGNNYNSTIFQNEGVTFCNHKGTFLQDKTLWTTYSFKYQIGVNLNMYPNKPVIASPGTYESPKLIEGPDGIIASWTFSDPNGDIQGAYGINLYEIVDYSTNSKTNIYNSSKVVSSATSYALPVEIQSQIKVGKIYQLNLYTYDTEGLISPAATTYFKLVNRAPSTPTTTLSAGTPEFPRVLESANSPLIGWSFSDPDPGDTQSAFSIEVSELLSSGGYDMLYSSGKLVNTSSRTFTLPEIKQSLLKPGKVYRVALTVYDKEGLSSPKLLNYVRLPNTAPNTPVMNNPKGASTNPALIDILTPELDWSFSDPDLGDVQSAYQVKVWEYASSQYTLVHDTGKVLSADTLYVLPSTVIKKGKVYAWAVMTWDKEGLASAYSSREFFKLSDKVQVGDIYTFEYIGGTSQTFRVPSNVTKIRMSLRGGSGGSSFNSKQYGGAGGTMQGDLRVTPGESLQVNVGGAGIIGSNEYIFNAGGWNGGGRGSYLGGSGGGATDIRRGGTTLSDRILIAAGGGGSVSNYTGGAGGYPSGHKNGYGSTGAPNQDSGYALGIGAGSPNSSNMYGGGGGGLWGGYCATYGGSGGSSYYSPTLIENPLYNTGNGTTTMSVDGKATIEILEVSSPPTITGRTPGTSDSLNPSPVGNLTEIRFAWDFGVGFTQSKYQLKVYKDDLVIHDSGLITSVDKFYTTPMDLVLEAGVTYNWDLELTDGNGVVHPTRRLYFITRRAPLPPVIVSPISTSRVSNKVEFIIQPTPHPEAEGKQHFILCIDRGSDGMTYIQSTEAGSCMVEDPVTREYVPFPVGGIDHSYDGKRVKFVNTPTLEGIMVNGKTYTCKVKVQDADYSNVTSLDSEPISIRVGDTLQFELKQPVITSLAADRILVTLLKVMANDGVVPATLKIEACNNALDESPTWENITQACNLYRAHTFTNKLKTNPQWAINIRVTIKANDTLGPLEVHGFGICFD